MKIIFVTLIVLVSDLAAPFLAHAGQLDIHGPTYSGSFGASVTVLPNGNFVVTDPSYAAASGTMTNVGAVYLYDGVTFAVISTLTGSVAGDRVGIGGITVLSNGNYVVSSRLWNGSRGAATWANGTTGVNGVVSAANSLVGTTANDQVGFRVTALNNGSYVVGTLFWNNGAVPGAGAATWANGMIGITGAVSAANSLVGSTANDNVGGKVYALNNGNYVVKSEGWSNGGITGAGAITWGNGTTGITGAVSPANSLVGSTVNDNLGGPAVYPLNNGNYVVCSAFWDNGAVTNAGAVTWANGMTGITGVVSSANSLVGSTVNDEVGWSGMAVLNNGNYVVSSPLWNNGAITKAGAATWGNGTSGVTGAVSSANSLIGSRTNDQVGFSGVTSGVTALNNGNYVVSSPLWNNGPVTNAGAATWGNGTSGVTGAVSSANSLIGSTANDQVSSSGVAALSNGNYAVTSPVWNNGAVTKAGAATWGNGTSGVTGAVSSANSLIGSTANDQVGSSGVAALNNGNYVVSSPNWDNGATANVGAVTWANGTISMTGTVASANSLIGSTTNDQVGSSGAAALNNGNYVVSSPNWDNGVTANVGAVTWANGTIGMTGTVASANSLIGSTANDQVGSSGAVALNDGNYVVSSPNWSGTRGALSLVGDTLGTISVVGLGNSFLGNQIGGGSQMVFAYDLNNTRLLVGYPSDNRASVFGYSPKLLVQQPTNVNLVNGGTRLFGAPVGAQASLTFTVKNIGFGNLTGLGITIDGTDAASFSVSTNFAASVNFNNPTTFTVLFAPLSSGTRTAALHLSSTDPQQNPFTVGLTGQMLSFAQDTDGDGLSDAEEFNLASLGFDWQVSQTSLVSSLFANANGAGLYTTNQIQALNVGAPLLTRDAQSGQFTLTIGVQKSTNLVQFAPFPMSTPQTTINGHGNLEFQFTVPDSAAFFRVQAQ